MLVLCFAWNNFFSWDDESTTFFLYEEKYKAEMLLSSSLPLSLLLLSLLRVEIFAKKTPKDKINFSYVFLLIFLLAKEKMTRENGTVLNHL